MKKNVFQSPALESETIETLSAKLLLSNNQLLESNKKLEQVQREREEMLANISHDLRAPITAIRSAVDYLLSGQEISPEDLQTSLQLINHRTRTLENLIQDMYYLFCVEDTSKALDFTTVDAAAFFEEYFYDALPDSRYDNHNLLLEIPEALHASIAIDIQKMVRVLDNLFTNAAKYSPAGSSITLKVQLTESEQEVLVTIEDTGMGIPPEALPHIFDRTYTVSRARTPNSATGSGLGLSIVKAIVERHGGCVSCESVVGKGSRFSFRLPISDKED